jgi:hypothetical protein
MKAWETKVRAERASSSASIGASAEAIELTELASTVICWETPPMFIAMETS